MISLNQILKPAILGGGVLLAGANAFALTDGPYNVVFPVGGGTTPLDFTSAMVLPKFNVGGGILQSISLTLSGNLTASQKFENTSGGGNATITLSSTGTMTLKRPDTTTLVITVPTVTNVKTVTADDGKIDFGGTSGFTFDDTSASLSNTQTYSGASDLALFTGAGNISLPVTAVGSSNGAGSANLITQFALVGGATASVVYTYSIAAVPEASTYGAIGAVSLAGFFGYRRSRRNATAHGIDRRIVDDDDADPALFFKTDAGHGDLPKSYFL